MRQDTTARNEMFESRLKTTSNAGLDLIFTDSREGPIGMEGRQSMARVLGATVADVDAAERIRGSSVRLCIGRDGQLGEEEAFERLGLSAAGAQSHSEAKMVRVD